MSFRTLSSVCILLAVATVTLAQEGVEIISIPDAWKRAPSDSASGKDGHCWFRCAVEIPAAWKDKDLDLYLEGVDDAREAYFNGVRIGGFGQFPPNFRSGLGGEKRFLVDAAHVKAGETNVVSIRIFKESYRSNFNVAAPVIFGPREAIRLEGMWQFRFGDETKWGKSFGNAAPPEQVVYGKLQPTDEVIATLKKLKDKDDGPLSIDETLKRISLPEDLVISVALSEPTIGQPLSIKWDDRGRMWVVEYLQYPNPAGLKMVSRDKYLRSVYDKVPPAPPNHFKGKDRISIHEDTDGDGKFDKHSAFVDDLSLVSSFAIGRGGVFVLNPPYLLFYADKNQDDRPDGDPEVLLEGFGIEDSHSIANSLRWGPDGWLYACQGSTVTGNIKRPGTKDKPVHSMGQLVWRYHPEKKKYEIFAEGGGNSFGLELDSKGRIYSGHNGGDTRGFHYVQGGYYRKGFGKHGELSNPYAYGYFPHMPHNKVPRFTHNFVIYEDMTLPAQYHGQLFGVAPLQSHVTRSDVAINGSTFKTSDVGHAMQSSDTWVRPVDIKVGPDGALYVADLYEQRIDHASHYQGRVHKKSGRVYRITGVPRKAVATSGQTVRIVSPKDQTKSIPTIVATNPEPAQVSGQPFKFTAAKSGDIVEQVLLRYNRWHRQTALRILGDRKDKSIIPTLKKNLAEHNGQYALECLWALDLSGGLDESTALKLLDHNNPYVRLWVVRLMCDDGKASTSFVRKINAIAGSEPSVETRCQIACSARRLKSTDCLGIVRNLLNHSADTSDPYMPLLLWWAIESKCESGRDDVVALFSEKEIWSLTIVQDHLIERLMRRFAQSGTRKDLLACPDLLLAVDSEADAKKLLAGFETAYKGRTLAGLPEKLIAAIAKSGGGSLALRMRQSEAKALEEGLAIAKNEKAKAEDRIQLIDILGQLSRQDSLPTLLAIAEATQNNDVRSTALNALNSYEDPAVAKSVLKFYNQISGDTQQVAASLLASRSNWSLALADAVDKGKVKRDDVPMDSVRRMLLHQDEKLQASLKKVWGTVQGATTQQMLVDIKRYTGVISQASGNPYRGKVLYKQTCAKCHVPFTDGAYIGPNLTSYKRDDLQRLMVNVVNPSIEIREGFENYVVLTADGRVLNGFLSDQDNQVVVLRSAEGQITVIPRDNIEEMKAIPRSIMPEGMLKPLSDQQVRDLFAYLRATQPLP